MQTNCQLFKCDCHVTTKSMRYLNLILDCFVQHVVATQGCVELNTDSQSCFCHFALQPCAFVLSTTSGCWSGAVHSAARLQLCEEHIGFGVWAAGPPSLPPALNLLPTEAGPIMGTFGEAICVSMVNPHSVLHLKREVLHWKKPTCYPGIGVLSLGHVLQRSVVSH